MAAGALCLVGMVVAEMLMSNAGVGFLVTGYRTMLDSPHGFASVLLVVVLAPLDAAARWAERRVVWNVVPRDWADLGGWVAIALAQIVARPWSLLVLHDLPTGATMHLDCFFDLLGERGGRVRQDFPSGCTPIVAGSLTGTIDHLVTTPA